MPWSCRGNPLEASRDHEGWSSKADRQQCSRPTLLYCRGPWHCEACSPLDTTGIGASLFPVSGGHSLVLRLYLYRGTHATVDVVVSVPNVAEVCYALELCARCFDYCVSTFSMGNGMATLVEHLNSGERASQEQSTSYPPKPSTVLLLTRLSLILSLLSSRTPVAASGRLTLKSQVWPKQYFSQPSHCPIAPATLHPALKLPSTDLLAFSSPPPDTARFPLIRAFMHLARRLRGACTAETALSCAPLPAGQFVL